MLGAFHVTARDATWTFDFETLRIDPTSAAHPLSKTLGQVSVPLAAIASVSHEPGRKGGFLRLHPRVGADPLNQATAGMLPAAADPFRLAMDSAGNAADADRFASGVHDALLVAQIADTPVSSYLVPGPRVPLSVDLEDGTVTFDGQRVAIKWGWSAPKAKRATGLRELRLADIERVEWTDGYLRFRRRGEIVPADPAQDPNSAALWGFKKDIGLSALIAAAVVARLPHPFADTPVLPAAAPTQEPTETTTAAAAASGDDHDDVLRRLRELGDLHRDGILTDDEFTTAKQALLRRL